MFDESKRQRAMRPDVNISRQALVIVAPINHRIAGWQLAAARLAELSRQSGRLGENRDRVRSEAEALLASVEDERRTFVERTRGLPASLSRSHRIDNTARALQSLTSNLGTALARFDASSTMNR